MGIFGGDDGNKNDDAETAPIGKMPPHSRRLSQSMINTETGKFMSKLINESSYLSGTGKRIRSIPRKPSRNPTNS